MLDRAREFLKRVKRDLKKRKILPLGGPDYTNRDDVAYFRRKMDPYREPTVHDRLGALADPEIKAWIDAYDEWLAAREAAGIASSRHRKAVSALENLDIARNLPIDDFTERWNPLDCDEDFFIPERAA